MICASAGSASRRPGRAAVSLTDLLTSARLAGLVQGPRAGQAGLDGAEQSEGCVEVAGVVAGGGSRGAGPFAADEGVVALAVLGWLDGRAAAVAGAGVALGEAFAL